MRALAGNMPVHPHSGIATVTAFTRGDVTFDDNRTAMLVWHERYPVGRGSRSGWVLNYDSDGQGHVDDYIVGLVLADVDAAVTQARDYLRSVGYPAGGWSLA